MSILYTRRRLFLAKTRINLLNPTMYKTVRYAGILVQRSGNGVKMTGTAEKSIYVSLVNSAIDTPVKLPTDWIGKTLTFFVYGTDVQIEIGLCYYNAEGKSVVRQVKALNSSNYNYAKKVVISLTENDTHYWIRARFKQGVTYDEYFEIMCVEGDYSNSDLPFQPYCRG